MRDLAREYNSYLLTSDMVDAQPDQDHATEHHRLVADQVWERLKQGAASWCILRGSERLPFEHGEAVPSTSALEPDISDILSSSEKASTQTKTTPFYEKMPVTGDVLKVSLGAGESEKELQLRKHRSIWLSEAMDDADTTGLLINTGGHVYSIDWAPQIYTDVSKEYLAVSASLDAAPRSMIGRFLEQGASSATIQIWSTDLNKEAQLDYVCCFKSGRISCLRWAPLPSLFDSDTSLGSIGLLAVAFQDGNVALFSLPKDAHMSVNAEDNSETRHLSIDPLIRFDAHQGVPISLAWHDLDTLAVAYSDGHLAVWSVTDALALSPRVTHSPSLYHRVGRSALIDIAFDTEGKNIFSAGYDGALRVTPLDEPEFSSVLSYQRDVCYATAYLDALNAPLHEKCDDIEVRVLDMGANSKIASRAIYAHHGRIRTMATSKHHPFVASGSADGQVKIGNAPLLLQSRKRVESVSPLTVYRLDMNRGTGALHFVDNILPAATKPNGGKLASQQVRYGLTQGWHPSILVTALRWNPNPGKEAWLASATAAGTVRLDYVGWPPLGTEESANAADGTVADVSERSHDTPMQQD